MVGHFASSILVWMRALPKLRNRVELQFIGVHNIINRLLFLKIHTFNNDYYIYMTVLIY